MSTTRATLNAYGSMLVLCCLLTRAGCALAEEPRVEPRGGAGRPAPDRGTDRSTSSGTARDALPADFHLDLAPTIKPEPRFDPQFERAPQNLGAPTGWGTEFRPRAQGLSNKPTPAAELVTGPSLHATNAWQRLEEFKTRRGIRLLTLWESKWSTLSLQAGKSGNPSLQWTSRSFSSGYASQGLFDQLVSRGLDELGSSQHHDGVALESPAAQK